MIPSDDTFSDYISAPIFLLTSWNVWASLKLDNITLEVRTVVHVPIQPPYRLIRVLYNQSTLWSGQFAYWLSEVLTFLNSESQLSLVPRPSLSHPHNSTISVIPMSIIQTRDTNFSVRLR